MYNHVRIILCTDLLTVHPVMVDGSDCMQQQYPYKENGSFSVRLCSKV